MEINVDIRPTGMESAVFSAPFDKALEALTDKGYKVISLPQNAMLRINQGKDSLISKYGNWVREGILYFPDGKPKLVRNSPMLYLAKEATEAHRQGKEFYPTKGQIEQALADSTDFPTKNIEIPANRLDSDALAVYAFGGEKEARAYEEFLRETGIQKIPVYAVDKDYVKKQNQPFPRQMWFGNFDGGSGLVGSRFLDYDRRLRGVKVGVGGNK
jgi:hypothetical protein